MPEFNSVDTVGIALAAFRRRVRMTQRELASEVGVSLLTVKHWENGRRRPSKAHLALLGPVLGLTLKEREDLSRNLTDDRT